MNNTEIKMIKELYDNAVEVTSFTADPSEYDTDYCKACEKLRSIVEFIDLYIERFGNFYEA